MAAAEDQMKQEIERLRRENESLRARSRSEFQMKVSSKGAASLYGLGRFPVTLYKDQWLRVLDMADEIRAFLLGHDAELARRDRTR